MVDDSSGDDEESPAEPDGSPADDALEIHPERRTHSRPLAESDYPSCPNCGETVAIVVTTGPTDHVASPCGCRLGSPER
ncbi:hypothetical protein [Natronorubrum sp. DTA28]|uniref:hypothetical protein n=1 Tax=Natronorubrum sp. DTA28 TaxID=3447019 RepID=UPI003F83A677